MKNDLDRPVRFGYSDPVASNTGSAPAIRLFFYAESNIICRRLPITVKAGALC